MYINAGKEQIVKTVVVPGNVREMDSGVVIEKGDLVKITADGNVGWAEDSMTSFPDGVPGVTTNPEFPMPDAFAISLIGKIGDNGKWFFIGAFKRFRAENDQGKLILGVNDDYIKDNFGNFRVVVTVVREKKK